jgi:hypothetical protein
MTGSRYPASAPRGAAIGRALLVGLVVLAFAAGAAAGAVVALRRGGEGGAPVGAVVTPVPTESAAAPSPSPTPEASPTPLPTPTPSPTPAPRNVGGLLIVDEVWTGRVVEAGGLRIRSAPRVEPGNVVGSVPQGAEVHVQGRVLNGQEAEPGKGTEWLIVGPNQFIYAGIGYVERVR